MAVSLFFTNYCDYVTVMFIILWYTVSNEKERRESR